MARQAVFFDLDGVLVDSRPGIKSCINATLVGYGLAAVGGSALDAVIGPPLHDGFCGLLVAQGADTALASSCVARYRELYVEASLRGTILQPGIRETLLRLEPMADLAIATSKPLIFVEPILRTLGIRNMFTVVEGPRATTQVETKTETLARAMRRLTAERPGSVTSEALMIGDRSHDMVAAINVGVAPIGANWGFGTESELRSAGAVIIIDAPVELIAITESA